MAQGAPPQFLPSLEQHKSRSILMLVAALALPAPTSAQSIPSASVIESGEPRAAAVSEVVVLPGLPPVGKWMIASDGTIAHWLNEIYEGKRLHEPINVILIDSVAQSAEQAKQRLISAASAAGYAVRFGHSIGYHAYIAGVLHAQLPAGRDEAFSDNLFELSNNHGRLFGPHPTADAYVSIGAFSREEVRLLRWPEHGYASFNRAPTTSRRSWTAARGSS